MDAIVDLKETRPINPAAQSHSSLREKLLEHLFVGELLRILWRRGERDLELLRAEVDFAGYDLVVACNGILRHVQLKSSYRGAKTDRVNINVALSGKLNGCVIWMVFDPDTMAVGPFYWLGNPPHQQAPSFGDRVARHSKGDRFGTKAARPNIRVVHKREFVILPDIEAVADALFGTAKVPHAA